LDHPPTSLVEFIPFHFNVLILYVSKANAKSLFLKAVSKFYFTKPDELKHSLLSISVSRESSEIEESKTVSNISFKFVDKDPRDIDRLM